MKKLLILSVTVVMLFSMSITALADPGNFIESPSNNKGPEIIEGVAGGGCNGYIVVTPYIDRHKLSDEKLAEIEFAYKQIVETEDITEFNEDFKDTVANKGLTYDKIAVSDLFDVSYYGCDNHEGHADFEITLKSDKLEGFVALLHMKDGEWELVKDATVEGDLLNFTAGNLSPYAIVVETDKHNAPQTGDDFRWWIYLSLMVVSAAALGVIGYKLKKIEE